MAETKTFLGGYRKFIFGLALTVGGVYLACVGDWDNAWKLLTPGIAIGIGGNLVDYAIKKGGS